MPAIVRAQGTQRYLKPIVAGLNSKVGDPSYESIARISKILKEKYDVELEIQVHPSSVLGNDLAQLESVQTGFIDITSNVTAQFGQYLEGLHLRRFALCGDKLGHGRATVRVRSVEAAGGEI